MLKKKIFVFLLLSLLMIPLSLAHFPEIHVLSLMTALNDPTWDSPLKQKIKNNLDVCNLALMQRDDAVIYYLTEEGRNKVYGGTHSIKMSDECNGLPVPSGLSKEQKEVYCTCGNIHIVHDPTSHGYKDYEGYTSLCVQKYASTNLFLHSICERSVVNNALANLDKFPYAPSADEIRLKTCDSHDLSMVGDEDISEADVQAGKCINPYTVLLSDSAGTNLCQASLIVGSNLKMMCTENNELGSAYTDVYRNQGSVAVPTVWKMVFLVAFFIILLFLIANMIKGTWWKYVSLLILIPMLFVSLMGIYYGYFAPQQFYHDYNFLMLDPLTKWINVPDWEDRVQRSIQDTKDYLSDPNYDVPKSASGLDHYEDGKLIKGPLDSAEWTGKIIWWMAITLFLALFIFLEYKVFKRKRRVI